MKLNDEEQAMLAGEMGAPRRWAMQHMIQVGAMFDAPDLVAVSQAHMMADPESLGEAGVVFLEGLAAGDARVSVPMITDPRGVDLDYYRPLGQTEAMANLERRTIAACSAMGIAMTNTCIMCCMAQRRGAPISPASMARSSSLSFKDLPQKFPDIPKSERAKNSGPRRPDKNTKIDAASRPD